MKRIVILLFVLVFTASIFAFEQGTKTVGGFIGYSSYKADADADAVSTIMVSPNGGYFIIDNLCICLNVDYESVTNGVDTSSFGLGIGGKYYYNNFYGGAGFKMQSNTYDDGDWDYKSSGNYLAFRIGYLIQIAENIYVDLAGNYKMGFGKYGGDMDEYDNEESELLFGGGIDIFFP